jgi:hypothetical protein
MAQLSNPSNLSTDVFPTARPAVSVKPGLHDNQKKLLGISAATLLLGGASWTIAQKISERKDSTPDNEPDNPDLALKTPLPDDIDVAGKVTDSMSFEQAFAAARDEVGMGGVFNWHGRWYHTLEKEEWTSLSLQQRQEYAEQITGEKLPVKPYIPQEANPDQITPVATADTEPTIIEGYLNGQRVMGLDFDHDGVIDTLVMDGDDGNTYKIVDASGNDGLDTRLRYDSLNGELMEVEKIDHPFVLSNDDFSQALEESMSKEVVDSILEPDAIDSDPPTVEDNTPDESEPDDYIHPASDYQADDDTYINNGDVRDMDE